MIKLVRDIFQAIYAFVLVIALIAACAMKTRQSSVRRVENLSFPLLAKN